MSITLALPGVVVSAAAPAPHTADVRSIYSDCESEADRFKWIESEKAGRDLGEPAIRRWVQDHWWT